MQRLLLLTLALVSLLGSASGCMMQPDARYVYQDGQYGVIGIPENTKFGRKNFQAQAHELMRQHFPDGYEIVRSEEVVEGQRSLDTGRKTEFATEPSINALDQMIKLGRLAETRSIEQKDSIPILESRIIYKRKSAEGPQGANGFAALASAKPEFYIDPNEMTRCKSLQIIADAKKLPTNVKNVELNVVKTSNETVAGKPAGEPEKPTECPHCKGKHP